MSDIRDALDDDDETRRLLAEFATTGRASSVDIGLPTAAELPAALLDLAVPHEDVDLLVSLRPRLDDPGESWLLKACVTCIANGMGSTDDTIVLPRIRESADPLTRYFYVFVYLAALPLTARFHAGRGIDPAITRATVADLGRNMALHRLRYPGVGGFENQGWLTVHFVGALYALGRLQFQRIRLEPRIEAVIRDAGAEVASGDMALNVHIPRFYGPLTAEVVDDALESARLFFAEHFPDERYRFALCESWLLDPQFADYLRPDSNILAFQRRFRPGFSEPGDANTLQTVFAEPTRPRNELPRTTRLERAVIDHLDAGRQWQTTTGWFEL
jgi:GNAT-like C-terminal domain/N-acyltransferase N-terminal domain